MAWNYLDIIPPLGVSATLIKALYAFDGTGAQLTDRSGNNLTLTAQGGSMHNAVVDGFVGFACNEEIYLKSGTATPVQTANAVTIEVLGFLAGISPVRDVWAQCGNSGTDGSASNNTLWQCAIRQDNARLQYLHEHTFGTDVSFTANAFMPVGTIHLMTWTRNNAGTLVKIYQDGIHVYSSSTLTAPSGGSAGYITIAANHDGTELMSGVCFGVRVTRAEFSAAQVMQSYKRVYTPN